MNIIFLGCIYVFFAITYVYFFHNFQNLNSVNLDIYNIKKKIPPIVHCLYKAAELKAFFLSENNEHNLKETKYFY